MTGANGITYQYGAENDLALNGSQRLYYDPLHRMVYSTQAATRSVYDGANLIAEYDASGSLKRRYVFGPGTDEPLVWYEGAGTTDKRWLAADERGSVVSVTNSTGTALAINSYDEYGIPGSTNEANAGRFRYTGQQWIPELGMYYYKARIYSPTFGRFIQVDPIGYGDGPNWYNYVGADPVNNIDPLGLDPVQFPDGRIVDCTKEPDMYDKNRNQQINGPRNGSGGVGYGPASRPIYGRTAIAAGGVMPQNEIVVTARRTTLPNVLPSTLWDHFLDGSGDTVCLSASQFNTLASVGKRVGNLAPRAGGGYAQETSYYGGTYANSLERRLFI